MCYKKLTFLFLYIKAIEMRTLAALFVLATVLATTILASTHDQGSSDEGIVVETAQGRLRGSVLITRKGRKIYSFRGVRFAQPPIGKLRFKVSFA